MAKKKKVPQEMVCQKNDELVLEIVDMGTEGEGIARKDGYTLFIKDAMVGDVVKASVMKTKKQFGYARLAEIITPSKDRVEPVCEVARQCGGCQLQHCCYERQLQWKEDKVRNCLLRIGKFEDIPMEPILSMETPFYYRNKAQFPVGTDKNGKIIAGFYAGRTHNIIENTDCVIQHPCNREVVEAVLAYMKEQGVSAYDEQTHSGMVRHILTRVGVATGEVMVCLVINGKSLPAEKMLVEKLLACRLTTVHHLNREQEDLLKKAGEERFPWKITSICINSNVEKTNRILGDSVRVCYGKGYIEDYIGDIKFRISPLSFYQVNPVQTKKLYDTALEFADLQGGETVWDLYCGIGTISLFLAQKAAKVYGVEIVPQAIEDAKRNAQLNGFENAEFFVGAAEQVVLQKYRESKGMCKADVVVLDPPRKGCEEVLLETVVQMNPEKIVYVSCDPATLARDLRYLCDNGFVLKRVRACDMFGMSRHVETVALLTRKAQ